MKSKIILLIIIVLFLTGCNTRTLEPHESSFEKGLNVKYINSTFSTQINGSLISYSNVTIIRENAIAYFIDNESIIQIGRECTRIYCKNKDMAFCFKCK